VYGGAPPEQLVSLSVDEDYPANVIWASEPQEGEEREADLAVLACAASELADRPLLPLGKPLAPRQYKIVSYLQLASAEGREPEHPATTWHPFIGQTPRSFELGNDSAKRIGHGDSGSPVMDADTGLVVGIVADVMAILTGGSENGVIVATAIDQLHLWPGMPSDLVIQTPRLPSAALWGVAGLTPGTPVRVLVAASDGLDNELAIVRETIDKIRHAPAARSFPVTLTSWAEIAGGQTAPRNKFFWEQRLEDFHGLILIAGSNLAQSAAGLGLEVPERATRDSRKSDGHQRGLIYRLSSGGGTPAGQSADGDGVARFFEELDQAEVPYVQCAADKFPEQFWSDFQSKFPYLIKRSLYPRQEGSAVPVPSSSEVTNPYLGLKSYRSEDGWRFHGRANEVTELRSRLAPGPRFLAVVGPSGCGKSSLVRAGLLYRLKLGAIAGSGAWKAIDIKISQTDERYGRPQPPLTTAAFEINRIIPEADRYKRTVDLEDQLRDGRDLDQVVNLTLKDRGDDARLVILIDQFEEVFTVVTDHDERAGFLSAVRDLSARPRVYVIISIRDDFYGRLMDSSLAGLKDVQEPYVVRPATVQSLFSAIYYPAALSGYSFEDESLPLEILEDAGTGVGALPLLSYALEKLVEAALARRGTVRAWELTREDYQKMGKVQGAIQETADKATRDLKLAPKTLGRLFRRLVTVDDQGKAAKKPALIDPQDPNWTEQEERLMDALIDARLLVSHLEDAPSLASAPRRIVIEIAHEALLRNWTELTQWVVDSRDALVLMQDVEKEARNWARERAKAPTIKEALDIDRQMLWPQERLEKVYPKVEMLGLSSANLQTSEPWRSARSAAAGALSGSAGASVSQPQPPPRSGNGLPEQVERFIQPEPDRLIEELRFPVVGHERRAEIGERLAQLGDRRTGVALTQGGFPDIAWLRVPGGTVNLVDTTGPPENRNSHQTSQVISTFEVKPFYIAQYPVTMRQFDVFARPNVYFDKRWWVDLAVDPDNHPVYPQKPGTANHPAQFVSFYQGVAFCNWLSKQLGYRVRLPAEWEWQQAATGGREGYLYPWGPAWDPNRANHRDGAYKLMAVGMYPDGRSPVGAYDMSGNMYEWCANEFDSPPEVSPTGTNARTTRGGAFFGTETDLRVTHRLRDNANGVNDLGKRIGVCIRLAADEPTSGIVEP